MKFKKPDADTIGIANSKALRVKDLCMGVGAILMAVGMYADLLGTKWAPIDTVKEEMKRTTKN